ncbi:hypothetical protein RHMOL_Rhmol01G0168800 [Rhododendron molle]|uniref:Uncharacterized protein n=1 Tax=Rhododendron molle TaxID=49168 RepID=A0ACC0Q3R3_RHOML|nr:hypothetical protein RHMOL_Rhmol01G0168800 [Rhododendron molle]
MLLRAPKGSVPTPETYYRGHLRALYRPRRHTTEGSVPTPETYYRGHSWAPYQPQRHTTEGSVLTLETQHQGLPSKPPTSGEVHYHRCCAAGLIRVLAQADSTSFFLPGACSCQRRLAREDSPLLRFKIQSVPPSLASGGFLSARVWPAC